METLVLQMKQTEPINSQIAVARIYDRALTAEEAQNYYMIHWKNKHSADESFFIGNQNTYRDYFPAFNSEVLKSNLCIFSYCKIGPI